MLINLTNYDTPENAEILIYRSNQSIDPNNLPPALVTLPWDTESFKDSEAELNAISYYRVGIKSPDTFILGTEYITARRYYTGPLIEPGRPGVIRRGDANLGTYGSKLLSELITSAALQELIGDMVINPTVDYNQVKLEKCVYGNKIYFVPDQPVVIASLYDFYKQGLLLPYGDGTGSIDYPLLSMLPEKVKQGKVLPIKGSTFRFKPISGNVYDGLYTTLFPTSELGSNHQRILANHRPFPEVVPTINENFPMMSELNTARGLDGTTTQVRYDEQRPLVPMFELVSRGDTPFPETDAEIVPAVFDKFVVRPGMASLNGKIHIFGGSNRMYHSIPQPSEYTHYIFDAVTNEQTTGAPLIDNVSAPSVWAYNNKLYCSGGVVQFGVSYNALPTESQNVNVWTADETEGGSWSTIGTDANFMLGQRAMTYVAPDTNVPYVMLVGADRLLYGNDSQKRYYYADLTTFDGTYLTSATSTMVFSTCDVGISDYRDSVYFVAGSQSSNYLSNTIAYQTLPWKIGDRLSPTNIQTQETEMGSATRTQCFVWRDTMFTINSASRDANQNIIYVYQWLPSEQRMSRIRVNLPEGVTCGLNAELTFTHIENRVWLLISKYQAYTAQSTNLVVFDLTDPQDGTLEPINEIGQSVLRFSPPFASVGT